MQALTCATSSNRAPNWRPGARAASACCCSKTRPLAAPTAASSQSNRKFASERSFSLMRYFVNRSFGAACSICSTTPDFVGTRAASPAGNQIEFFLVKFHPGDDSSRKCNLRNLSSSYISWRSGKVRPAGPPAMPAPDRSP